jgi:hypothetical protein
MTLIRAPFLLLVLVGACGVPLDPASSDGSSGTSEPGDASTGAGGSASATNTSTTTGQPPATTSTADGDATEDTGVAWIFEPDGGICIQGGGTPDGMQVRCTWCTPSLQDCPAGEKCVPWSNDGSGLYNATRCSPVPDDAAAVGEPCVTQGSPVSGFDDCELGALCFGADPQTLQGTCVALCDSTDPAGCGEDEVCLDYGVYEPWVCLPRCDPNDPSTCARDETCRMLGNPFAPALLCVPTVSLPQGLACGAVGQYCAPEETCLPAADLASCGRAECCTPWCDLSAADPDLPCGAAPGEVCRPFFAAPPAGYEHVGVCALPG